MLIAERVSANELAATAEVHQRTPNEAMDAHQHAFVVGGAADTIGRRQCMLRGGCVGAVVSVRGGVGGGYRFSQLVAS